VPRHVRLTEILVGVEGLALLRHLYDGNDDAAEARLAEVCALLADESLASGGEATTEQDPRAGYAAWSASYDEPGNPIVALEEPVVHALIEKAAPGRALDAACGTGRHARRLAELGHEVVGVDVSPEMLERARAAVPQATFHEGDLRALDEPDASFDLVVCGLALAHLPDLGAGVAELARLLKPGGRLVVSVLHPLQAQLGWHARFTGTDGRRGFVREHPHTHADHLAAFRATGLEPRDCVEPRLAAEHVRAMRRAYEHAPRATEAAYAGLPAVLVWEAEKC
jgi:SAM-dependent methyltransferase